MAEIAAKAHDLGDNSNLIGKKMEKKWKKVYYNEMNDQVVL